LVVVESAGLESIHARALCGREFGMFRKSEARVVTAEGMRGREQEMSWRKKATARLLRSQEGAWVFF
jgi:hypothetical protein